MAKDRTGHTLSSADQYEMARMNRENAEAARRQAANRQSGKEKR